MDYRPSFIDSSSITLPADLVSLTERLAEHSHDNWARQRLAEGWTAGPNRDDAKKEHPHLVPYDRLRESEKQHDRNAALETLKPILALDYGVSKT